MICLFRQPNENRTPTATTSFKMVTEDVASHCEEGSSGDFCAACSRAS